MSWPQSYAFFQSWRVVFILMWLWIFSNADDVMPAIHKRIKLKPWTVWNPTHKVWLMGIEKKTAERCFSEEWNSPRSGMFLHSSALEGEGWRDCWSGLRGRETQTQRGKGKDRNGWGRKSRWNMTTSENTGNRENYETKLVFLHRQQGRRARL